LFGLGDRYRTTAERYITQDDLAAVYIAGVGVVGVVKVAAVVVDQQGHSGWKRGGKESTAVPALYSHRLSWKWFKKLDTPAQIGSACQQAA
jgi:hypothetical protein